MFHKNWQVLGGNSQVLSAFPEQGQRFHQKRWYLLKTMNQIGAWTVARVWSQQPFSGPIPRKGRKVDLCFVLREKAKEIWIICPNSRIIIYSFGVETWVAEVLVAYWASDPWFLPLRCFQHTQIRASMAAARTAHAQMHRRFWYFTHHALNF